MFSPPLYYDYNQLSVVCSGGLYEVAWVARVELYFSTTPGCEAFFFGKTVGFFWGETKNMVVCSMT